METFGWLHLSDLHWGMTGQGHLWPNIREQFLDDLKNLHERCGPWQAVFFTGDFVQRGTEAEFQRLDEVLGELWGILRKVGSDPVLLGVPGNHDLCRPPRSPAVKVLSRWDEFPEVQAEFWETCESPYRQVVDHAFEAYSAWWAQCPFRNRLSTRQGTLPGDFSATITHRGLKVGVVGLNTAFLQLTEGDYQGKLACNSRQFHAVCDGDHP